MFREAKFGWGVAGLCLLAFMSITLLTAQIFEHVPHSEDEVAYLFQARVFAQNRLAAPTPENEKAFWTPFVVDYNGLRFGKYPPGWPLMLSMGVRFKAPWLVNAWLGTLTLALIAWLGRCLYRPKVGWLAAGLGLVTPGFLFLSSSLLSHTASLFWATVALVALFYGTTKHPRYNLITGLALGATFAIRPFAGIGIGLAVGLFILIMVYRGKLKWTSILWLSLGWVPVAALLPLFWWAVTGNPTFNAYLLVWPYDRIGFGPDIGPGGYSLREAILINTRLKLATLATGLFGWPGWSNLLFIPIPFLARRANRWDWLLLSTMAGMIFVHVFYWAFGGTDGGFPRYYYDALPALLLLTARGILILIEIFSRFSLPVPGGRLKLGWLPVGLVLVFLLYNFFWTLPPLLAFQKGKYNITPAPLRVVEQANLTEPALIIVKNIESWSDFAAPFAANSPTLDGPVVFAMDRGPDYNRKVRSQFRERTCWQLENNQLSKCESVTENR